MSAKNPKILHITTSLGIGGAENMLFKLLTAETADKSASVLCLMDEGYYGPLLAEQGIKVHCLGLKKGQVTLRAFIKAIGFVRSEAPDLVMTWGYHADLLGVVLKLLLSRFKLVWNIRCSDLDLKKYGRFTAAIVKLLAFLSFVPNAAIANSSAGVAAHRHLGYKIRHWEVIPNGFDTTIFRFRESARTAFLKKFDLPEQGWYLGCVARWDPAKNIDGLVNAFRLIRNENVKLLLIGPGMHTDNPALMKLISDLDGKVFPIGPQTNLELIYPALDALALVSRTEGFPNVIGEAMSCGTAIIASDVGDNKLITGGLIPLCKPESMSEIQQAIEQIVHMPAPARKDLGLRLRAHVETRFSLALVADSYQRFLLNIHSKSPA